MGNEGPKFAGWRSMPVCAGCWAKREPEREAARIIADEERECICCEEPTTDGIYVRMRVEWR